MLKGEDFLAPSSSPYGRRRSIDILHLLHHVQDLEIRSYGATSLQDTEYDTLRHP